MKTKFNVNTIVTLLMFVSIALLNYLFIAEMNPLFYVTVQFISVIIIMWFVDFDIAHPYTWFCPFWFLYSYSFYVDKLLLDYDTDIMRKISFYQWTALVCFCLAVMPTKKRMRVNTELNETSKRVFKLILFVSVVAIVLMCVYAYVSDASTKKELALERSPVITLGKYAIQFFTIAVMALSVDNIKVEGKIPKFYLMLVVILSLFVMFFVGERDMIVRIVFIIVLVYHIMIKRVEKKQMIIYGVIALLLLGLSESLKSIFLDFGNIVNIDLNIKLIPSEFYGAGRNLYIINSNDLQYTFVRGNAIFDRLIYCLSNFPFINIETDVVNSTTWFNTTYYASYVARGGGKGFTLVGDALLYGNIISIACSFFAMGLLVKFLYAKASDNMWFLFAYLLVSPMTIYCLRADFCIYLSYIFKYVLVPFVIFRVINKVYIKV